MGFGDRETKNLACDCRWENRHGRAHGWIRELSDGAGTPSRIANEKNMIGQPCQTGNQLQSPKCARSVTADHANRIFALHHEIRTVNKIFRLGRRRDHPPPSGR